MLAAGLHPGEGVDAGFEAQAWSGFDVWCLVIAYGFQLFFDFAGYSHLVIGAARLFGIQLAENFDRPYLSTTPAVFWTRWHMSLSFWIRDYLFLPLATLHREMRWRNLSLMLSMVLFGLWHRGSLLFLIWGAYHGALLVLHRQWQQLQQRMKWNLPAGITTPLSWLLTLAAICAGWIFFRTRSLGHAAAMWSALLHFGTYYQHFLPFGFYALTATVVLGYFGILALEQLVHRSGYEPSARLPIELKAAVYAVIFYVAVFHGAEPQGFTYFQF